MTYSPKLTGSSTCRRFIPCWLSLGISLCILLQAPSSYETQPEPISRFDGAASLQGWQLVAKRRRSLGIHYPPHRQWRVHQIWRANCDRRLGPLHRVGYLRPRWTPKGTTQAEGLRSPMCLVARRRQDPSTFDRCSNPESLVLRKVSRSWVQLLFGCCRNQ